MTIEDLSLSMIRCLTGMMRLPGTMSFLESYFGFGAGSPFVVLKLDTEDLDFTFTTFQIYS